MSIEKQFKKQSDSQTDADIPTDKQTKTQDENQARKSTQTQRDEQTLGRTQDRQAAKNTPGFADEVQPAWAPPESQPEPLTNEPIMSQNQPYQSNQNSNTSPA